ncbi:MAG: DUF2905 domain-containing protein [Chloroflexi bacterium]|nr:DUF2905 domain-containing protein [Chloroflexota bacterium]
MDRQAGLIVVAVGVAVVILGLLISTGALGWFGRLPGDIRIERESVRVYVPVTSMVLASIVLSALIALLRRLF